jgi:hypothetical protein
MTTYSKDTEWGRKYRTDFHLVYRIKDGALEPYGLFETRAEAEENLALINQHPRKTELFSGWQIADVSCRGWGVINDRIDRNSRPETWSGG